MSGPPSPGSSAYDDLGDLYDLWCAEVDEDVPFYLELADALTRELRVSALRIVELGAGSGRIALPLARAGHHVTAIDTSTSQLAALAGRAAAADVGAAVSCIDADMRLLPDLVAPGSVDLVVAPFRSLLHVTGDRDALFAAVRDVLVPGGALAFDVFHPGPETVAATCDRWLHRRDAAIDGGSWRFEERASYEPTDDGHRLSVEVRCSWAGDSPHSAQATRATRLDLVVVPATAWLASLEQAGLTVDAVYGWFDACPLEPSDDDSVWVARRPAGD